MAREKWAAHRAPDPCGRRSGTVRLLHEQSAEATRARLAGLTHAQLVELCLDEARLKNEAYYFLIDKGLLGDLFEHSAVPAVSGAFA